MNRQIALAPMTILATAPPDSPSSPLVSTSADLDSSIDGAAGSAEDGAGGIAVEGGGTGSGASCVLGGAGGGGHAGGGSEDSCEGVGQGGEVEVGLGGGIGGKMGCCTSTDRAVLSRPRPAESVARTRPSARLPSSSSLASAAPPEHTAVHRAPTPSSDEEVVLTLLGSGTAAIIDVLPVTGRTTCTSTWLLSSRAM